MVSVDKTGEETFSIEEMREETMRFFRSFEATFAMR